MGVEGTSTTVIDIVETVAIKLGIHYHRGGDNEISLILSSKTAEYYVGVELRQDIYEALYFSSDLNIEVAAENYQAGVTAVVKANEHSWLGHFDLTSADSRIMYVFTIPFASSFSFDEINTEAILTIILDECDRFHQYFSMAINGRDMSDMSINTLFFDALGEA